MVRDPKIVQYVEELDLLIIADGGKVYHINGDVIAGMWKAYMEGHGIDYDICEGCECVDPETAEPIKHGRWIYPNDETLPPYCSECKQDAIEYIESGYCPNCGAKMDLPEPQNVMIINDGTYSAGEENRDGIQKPD